MGCVVVVGLVVLVAVFWALLPWWAVAAQLFTAFVLVPVTD